MDNTTAIDEAVAPGAFDIFSYIEDTAYPTKTVTIYRDVASAKELLDLVDTHKAREDQLDVEAENEYDAKVEELSKKVLKSALHFELRGFAPGVVEDIMAEHEGDSGDPYVIAKAIVTVKNADGAEDTRTWTADDVNRLRRAIPEGEFAKLLGGVAEVVFMGAIFDRAVDAGFLSGRTDVAE